METHLTELEARVLGCLIEKSYATPDIYPLTLRALTAACNQRSNRDPVMDATEAAVEEAVTELRLKRLARMVSPAGGRVMKFRHTIEHFGELNTVEQAILCELLVRGPQTQAELRNRIARLEVTADAETVATAIQSLIAWGDDPLAVELPREPGRREPRVAHCLCGTSQYDAATETEPSLPVMPLGERVSALEQALAAQHARLDSLETQFAQFKAQFE